MSDRKTISARVDESLYQVIRSSPRDNQDIIIDGVKKELLAARDESLPIELEQLRRKVDFIDEEIEKLEAERSQYADRIEEIEGALTAIEPIIEEAASKLLDHMLEPDNAAVLNWAGKAGIEPEELITRVRELKEGEEDANTSKPWKRDSTDARR